MASIPGYVNLYTTRAHVFQINTETKTSWLPKGDSAIPISIVTSQIDSPQNKKELKIIGTADNGELALDCVVAWDTVFNKRSQKFVQWPDQTGMVYGLGFNSEADLNEFIETFMEFQQKIFSNNLNVDRQRTDWNASQQQSVNPSEMNGRVVADHNTNVSRTSSSNLTSQYSNTLQGINNNIGDGGLNDNMRYPQRSQSTTVLQTNKYGGTLADANGAVAPTNRVSPDVDDSHSVQSEQLKYENERLRQALEESSKNAVVWQNELLNLRTNNVKLTQALQESKAHVEEWEKELVSLRDTNKQLQMRVMWLESKGDSKCDTDLNDEHDKYKNYNDEIHNELRRKDSELEKLRKALEQMEVKNTATSQNGDSNTDILSNNSGLKQKLDVIAAKLQARTHELNNVQKELTQLVDKIHEAN